MKLAKNNKGQVAVVNLLFVFITAILLFALLPTIQTQVDTLIAGGGLDTATQLFASLIPMFFIIALLGMVALVFRPSASQI